MKNQGTLAVLLILAAALIYSAAQYPRDTMHSRRHGADAAARMADGAAIASQTADEWIGPALEGAHYAQYDAAGRHDTSRFVCKLPAEVGPVPLLEAVDAYLRGLPESRRDPALVRGLHRAAQQGNWLAKVQVYLSNPGDGAPDDSTVFRTITLIEWMQEHRIGALYAALGDAVDAAGKHRATPAGALSSLDIYAAMHHNYPSQYKVGHELLRSGDRRQAAVGRRMLDCAARALPVYRQADGERVVAARG